MSSTNQVTGTCLYIQGYIHEAVNNMHKVE